MPYIAIFFDSEDKPIKVETFSTEEQLAIGKTMELCEQLPSAAKAELWQSGHRLMRYRALQPGLAAVHKEV